MSPVSVTTGDFGHRRRAIKRDQVVGIFDLVGFTQLESNDALVHAVRAMQTELELALEPRFYWGEGDRVLRNEESARNDILLRSTGDGYVLAFSQHHPVEDSLQLLTRIHAGIRAHNDVCLGISRGSNYVLSDLNERVNIIGWGINTAARALSIAEPNQIICTAHFAEPLVGDNAGIGEWMLDIGTHTVKHGQQLHVYHYYRPGEFGAASAAQQDRTNS